MATTGPRGASRAWCFFATGSLLLAGCTEPAPAADADVWIGTWNAPGLWRVIEIDGALVGVAEDASGDGVSAEASRTSSAVAASGGRAGGQAGAFRVGTATARSTVPLLESGAPGDSVHLVAEVAGAHVHMDGRVAGVAAGGSLRILRGETVLSGGGWSLRRLRPAAISGEDLAVRVRQALGADTGTNGVLTVAQNPVDGLAADPPGWRARLHDDGRFLIEEGGTPSLAFDGAEFVTVRAPIGLVSSNQRLVEKLALVELLRSGAWLRAGHGLSFSAWETGDGAAHQLVLGVQLQPRAEFGSEAVVPAWVFLDPTTSRPESADVEWDAGPFRMVFGDYEEHFGRLHPGTITTSYRGKERTWKTVAIEAGSADAGGARRDAPTEAGNAERPQGAGSFSLPAPPGEVVWDRTASPHLDGRHGAGDDGHLFVRPRIGGPEVGWFHIDTGAPFLMLDAAVADSLGLEVIQQMGPRSARRLPELRLGQLVLRDQVVMVGDLSEASAPAGSRRAGVLGGPAFATAIVEFDYEGKRLSVFAPEEHEDDGYDWLPLRVESSPVVTAKFPGGEDRFFLDTGKSATVSFTSHAGVKYGLHDGAQLVEVENLTNEGPSIELERTLPWFELGGRRFEQPSVHLKIPGTPNDDVYGTAGWIGRGFIGDRKVVFDYAGGRIAFVEGR